MKIFREAQKRVAKAVLNYKLQRQGAPQPSEAELDRQSERLAEEANRVLKATGKRLLDEAKDGCRKAAKKYSGGSGGGQA